MKNIVLGIFTLLLTISCVDKEKSDEFLNSGLSKRENGDFKGAIQDFNEAIKVNSKNSKAYYWRAFVKHDINDYEGAIEDCNKTIEIDPKFADAYFERGVIKFTKLMDFEGAYSDYSLAIKINPNNPIYYSNRATVIKYLPNLDPKNIISDCTKAIELDQKNGEYFFQRGLSKFKLNLPDACLDLMKAEELGYKEATEAIREMCN